MMVKFPLVWAMRRPILWGLRLVNRVVLNESRFGSVDLGAGLNLAVTDLRIRQYRRFKELS